jgi:cob(I)alamin adenosyltransferase
MPRIYTRTGDDGTTGRLYGGRISKADEATEAYGTTDEAVAAIGVARAHAQGTPLAERLLELQRELFVVGAELAANPAERGRLQPGVSLVTASMVRRLEALIDDEVERRPLPTSFIVPGADPVSASIDLARSIVRRAERESIRLREAGGSVHDDLVRYLNRLSDLLFVLARSAAGGAEPASRG